MRSILILYASSILDKQMIISTDKLMGIQEPIAVVVPLALLLVMYISFDVMFEINDNESVILYANKNV